MDATAEGEGDEKHADDTEEDTADEASQDDGERLFDPDDG